jgi:TolA protein
MVLASGGLHLVAIAVILFMPQRFAHRPPPLVSYTVDLVAPDRVGGTNIVPGGKGRVEGAPMAAAAPKVEPPKPPPPKVEEPKPAEPKPEPPKPEAQKPEQVVSKPEAKPAEPPKAEEKPHDEMALVEKTTVPAPTTQVKPPPSPQAAKAEPPKQQPAEQPKVDAKAAAEAKKAAETKAAADAKAAKEAAAARQRDEQIAAAIRRVEQRTGVRGGGTGQKPAEQPGGPISVGPREGVGGTVMGVEYLLYYNQLQNRIKQSWVWAGADRSLEAVVRFNITETGEVLNVRIARSSGDRSYDASVERAVRAINPLPPPPAAYRKQFSDVEVPFSPEQLQQ